MTERNARSVRDAIRDALSQLVDFHGDRSWNYRDVETAADVIALAVDDAAPDVGPDPDREHKQSFTP